MKLTPAHIVIGILFLIIGAIGGRFLWPFLPHPPFHAAGTNAIIVGPHAKDLSIPTNDLWQDQTHDDVLIWVALDPRSTLFIDFKDEVFEGMTQPSPGIYRVQCAGSRCDSGKIKKGAKHQEYKYAQTLVDPSGKKDYEDGHIIIKP
jgi:hypothetical protein